MYKVKKRNKIYYIIGRVNGTRLVRSLRTTEHKLAEEIANHIYNEELLKNHGITSIKEICLKEFMEKYLSYCDANNKPSTASKKRFDVQFILAHFGDIPLCNITTESIESFKTTRRLNVAPATINNDLATLKHALNLAVEWDYLNRSPASKVKKFSVNNQRIRFLSHEEADKLIAECSEELKPVVITALYTGMRQGEILALDWCNVDLQSKQITIIDSKNHDSRVVPINDLVYNAFSVIEPKEGLVFRSRLGGPYKSVHTGFKAAVKRAGIKDFRFHDLRHTFTSWLRSKGADRDAVRILLGHKTDSMTTRYTHFAPDYMINVIEKLTQI